jgi:hypothetical protein
MENQNSDLEYLFQDYLFQDYKTSFCLKIPKYTEGSFQIIHIKIIAAKIIYLLLSLILIA